MKYIVLSVLALLTCISFQSCSEDDIMFYEGGNAVHFLSTSQEKSFALEPDAETAIMQIPVQLVGNLPEKDLTFSVEVIDDGESNSLTIPFFHPSPLVTIVHSLSLKQTKF